DFYQVREWTPEHNGRYALVQPKYRSVEQYKGEVECLRIPAAVFYVRDAESTQGFWTGNSENVLLVVDEASGVPEPVFEAGVGSMSGHNATTILLGNPTRSSGFFFNTHPRNRGLWKTYHITGVPGSPGHYSPRVSADF